MVLQFLLLQQETEEDLVLLLPRFKVPIFSNSVE